MGKNEKKKRKKPNNPSSIRMRKGFKRLYSNKYFSNESTKGAKICVNIIKAKASINSVYDKNISIS